MLFLFSRLVDDVASHVRLFKKARLSLRTRNREEGKLVDLVRQTDKQTRHRPGNTKGESITVLLTSFLTGLESAV
jgi:hypothetical protein